MGRGWVAGCRGGVAVVSRLSHWCHFLSNRRRLPRNLPDGGVTLRVPGNSYATTCLSPEQVYRAIAGRQSELAAKCKQQRDEWIDLMFKPRIASPPRVAAPPQVPGGPPKPKKKKGKK